MGFPGPQVFADEERRPAVLEDPVGPVEPQSLNTLCLKSLKRTRDMFVGNYGMKVPDDSESQRIKVLSKVLAEYEAIKDMNPAANSSTQPSGPVVPAGSFPLFVHPTQQTPAPMPKPDDMDIAGTHPYPSGPGVHLTSGTAVESSMSESQVDQLLSTLPKSRAQTEASKVSSSIVEYQQRAGAVERYRAPGAAGNQAIALIRKSKPFAKPDWHPPWKMMRVISGHLGWVRAIAVDCSNEWFATGSADRTIKIWDLASGQLKLTLTGHINTIRGLAVDERHPYLFSCGEDKTVKCWDLEYNKVIRSYHGHLSGVYCIALHPTIDVLMTGGRDSVCRVWDMRTKQQVHCLVGHTNTVVDIKAQAVDPQIITSCMDTTVRLWDLTAGKCQTTLTNHKKSVRALAMHPSEFTFASASADNIKKWKLPEGVFLNNIMGHKSILNCLAVNSDGVMAAGGDNGSMSFWDWKTGYNFQTTATIAQPGSLDSEAGIFCCAYDATGSRLITGEADKTVKMWKEDEDATPETHPINFKPELDRKRW